MVPTRELAVQVEEEARILGSCMKLKSASFYGGVGYGRQIELLNEGVDVIIGTPGRVIDLQESRQMNLSQVAFLVIDEADRMFDMGFYPDLRTLIKVLPPAKERQTMLFSATLNATVKNLAWEYTVEAKEITIECENVTVDEIDQMLFHVSSDQKMRLLLGLIEREKPDSLIVFCNTKRMSEVVAKRLQLNGFEADFIIGDLPQSKRLQVIDSFKSGSLKMLVATDVAARGIDVDSLSMVINYDLPNEAENYVHRIGRTARAGKTGIAYSFCSEQDVYNLPAIEKYVENKVPSCVPGEDDFVADKSAGKYIRTDCYDSDYSDEGGERGSRGRSGGSRSGRPSGGRSGGSRSGSGRSSGGRPSGGRPDSRDGRGRTGERTSASSGEVRLDADARARAVADQRGPEGMPRSGGRRFENSGRPDGRRGGPRNDAREREERDLSKLSFEERMAYYKNKYGSDEAAKAAENQREAAHVVSGESITKSGTKVRDASRPRDARNDRRGENRADGRPRPDNRPRGTSAPETARPRSGKPDGERKPNGDKDRQATPGQRSGRPAQGRGGQGKPGAASRPNQGATARGAGAQRPAGQGSNAQGPKKPAQKGVGLGAFIRRLLGN
jgi:ATP-dependent RNA helicase RhlB